jgi:hypothetical protein
MVKRLVKGPSVIVCDICLAVLPERVPAADRQWLRHVNFTDGNVQSAVPWGLPKLPNNELIVFQHLPKSGGTTIDFILAATAARCGLGYRRFGVSTAFAPPVWLVPGWTGAWDTIKEYAETQVADAGFGICGGHFPHGVHELLRRPARYVTLIRDPLDRELSSFNYHYQNGVLDESISLEDLIEQGHLLDNPQTRMLAGRASMRGPCSEETFQLALLHLERDFDLVGVTEQVQGFIAALLGRLGFPAVTYERSRVTVIRRIETANPRLLEIMRRAHVWDLKLHCWCKERWREFEEKHHHLIPAQTLPTDAEEIIPVSGELRVSDSSTARSQYPTGGPGE